MKKNIFTILITLLAVASILVVLEYNASQGGSLPGPPGPPGGGGPPPGAAPPAEQEQPKQAPPQQSASAPPDVAVISVSRTPYSTEVQGFGEAASRYSLSLTAEVSGRITELANEFESGRIIKKGDLLARIDDTAYLEALRNAQASLKEAELALLEEQREGEQAVIDWNSSGLIGEPDSPLVLRGPQLASAEAAVANAKAAVRSAQRDLERTRLTTPFDALIISRDIAPGSYVQQGTSVASLYSTDRVEISVPLSEQQWQLLPTAMEMTQKKWPAQLQSIDKTQHWKGYILRVEQHENESRQRSLVISVDQPLTQSPALFPGSFIQAEVTGRQIADLWKLPAASLSQRNEIWLVTSENTLESMKVSPLFTDSDFIYIQPPENYDQAQVVARALMSYLAGMRVNPKPIDL